MTELILKEVDQPKPKFTLLDLEAKLGQIYNDISNLTDFCSDFAKNTSDAGPFKEAVNIKAAIHELFAIVVKIKTNLGSIDLPIETAKAITDTIQTEKPEFTVCGVQLIENGVLQGTSLYSTIVKARKIRDVLNARFAELQVKHEAKILNYPVY